MPVLSFEMNMVYESLPRKLRLKYLLDRILAFYGLIVSFPLFAIIFFLIKFDGWRHPENKGSVFYTEPRFSAGKKFRILKFRTAPQRVVDWVQADPEARAITTQSEKTWAGKWILRWYLDELPQLVNILKGEMTFVGPRPHILAQYEDDLRHGFEYRKYIKAGLLGVPQACKRYPQAKKNFEQMARSKTGRASPLNTLDGLYAKICLERNVWGVLLFDLWLVWKGLVIVARAEGAKSF